MLSESPRRLPPINAIRVFEAAARLSSFTRAGEELGMTQAAVSYQIKLLEERLGFLLFTREPRRVTLTPKGERLSTTASEAFRMLEGAFAAVSDSAENVLSITTWSTFSAKWLAPRIGAFQIAHPKLAVRVDTSERLIDLTREDFDIAIRTGSGDWPGHETRLLFDEPAAALVSARAAAKHRPLGHPRDLLALRLIGPLDWWRRWFALCGVAESELPERTQLEFETQYMDVAAAAASEDAAVIVAPRYFEPELASGLLVRPFETVLDSGQTWIVYDQARRHAPKIRAFVAWVLEQAGASAADASAGKQASTRPKAGLSTAP